MHSHQAILSGSDRDHDAIRAWARNTTSAGWRGISLVPARATALSTTCADSRL
jgi:hypothetical protein